MIQGEEQAEKHGYNVYCCDMWVDTIYAIYRDSGNQKDSIHRFFNQYRGQALDLLYVTRQKQVSDRNWITMSGETGRKTRTWVMLSPWIVISAVIILVPIFILMTFYSIEKQRNAMTSLLAEKGAALIRSIEAGVRAERPDPEELQSKLQSLVVETARQPDILYLAVTNLNGFVVAHSNPGMIGTYYGRELDLREIAAMDALFYRTLAKDGDEDIFEVFRFFEPAGGIWGSSFDLLIPDDIFHGDAARYSGFMIFVGLDRKPVASVLRSDTRVTVTLAVILLLLGLTGVISLLIAQGYRQVRASLSLAKAFSDNLLENVPIGIIAIESGGSITSFNKVAEALLGVPARAALKKPAGSTLPFPLVKILERLEKYAGPIEEEVTCPLRNNGEVSLDVIATRLVERESFAGYVLIIRDLTEMKRLQNEIDRSNRLATLGRMAAGVAHEIRNPLSSIKGFATFFMERYREIPEDRKIAEVMIDEVDRLDRVVGQLLDFSRPARGGNTVKVPVGEVIRSSLDMVTAQAEKQRVVVETDLQEEDREIFVDAHGLRQALLNLYINALEAMPDGGRLTVRLRGGDNGGVIMDIGDTGQGIAREDLSKIFEPYFTTKPSGTGLGLAIVQKIIEAHGGIVTVAGETGGGALFTLSIPEGDNGREK